MITIVMHNSCFTPIEVCTEAAMNRVFQILNTSTQADWKTLGPGFHYFLPLPHTTFNDCPKLNAIMTKFGGFTRAAIVRTDPNTHYSWHVDANRDVCLNMLLNNFGKTFSCFGKLQSKLFWGELMQLNYEPKTMYLFNTQHMHYGVNFSDNARYLVSISLRLDDDIVFASFNDVLDYFNQNLI